MGGRFRSFDQTHLERESTLVEIMSFRPEIECRPKKEEKKEPAPEIEEFLSPKSSEDKKKKVFTATWD